jgi:hypothetical protein
LPESVLLPCACLFTIALFSVLKNEKEVIKNQSADITQKLNKTKKKKKMEKHLAKDQVDYDRRFRSLTGFKDLADTAD